MLQGFQAPVKQIGCLLGLGIMLVLLAYDFFPLMSINEELILIFLAVPIKLRIVKLC